MAKAGFPQGKEKAPEETHEGKVRRGGASKRHEGGFAEGDYGRGPTPFSIGQSAAPKGQGLKPHLATAGRGGTGIFGKGDAFKTRAEDVEHPASHAEFERLGTAQE